MFKEVGDVLSGLFNTKKAADDILDKDNGLLAQAGAWVGNMNFTPEEQAEMNKQLQELAIRKLEATTQFKVVQRIMVSVIMFEWMTLFNCIVYSMFTNNEALLNNLLRFSQTQFAWMPIAAAVGLYLLGGVLPYKGK